MKIVDAPRPTTKRAQYRKTVAEIQDTEMAAKFEVESDMKYFCKVARAMGKDPRIQKLQKGGWLVWL